MSEIGLKIRCMRCGTQMDLRDPVSVETWKPDQFWVCPKCGRHFWTTYPPPAREKVAAAAPPAQPTGKAENAPTTTAGNVPPNPAPAAPPTSQS